MRLLRAAPRIVAVIAAAAIVGQVAATGFALIGDSRVAHERVPARAARAPKSRLDPAVGELFGLRPKPLEASAGSVPAVPLVLTGVIADTNPAQGFGILGQTANRTALYAVGAALPGDARLVAVYVDRVEVERAGIREPLRLPVDRDRGTMRTALTAVTAPAAAETVEPEAPSEPPAKFWLVHHLTFESTDAGGRVIGYELTGGGKRSVIQKGDILTAINGVPLTDRSTADRLIDEEGSKPAQLTVLRGGSPVVVMVHPDL
jgi:type II secretion system protein C